MGPQVRKGKGGCPYLAGAKSEVAQLADAVLAAPLDVEELAAAGRRSGACPYYAARRAVPQADLLLLPYPSLLLKAHRTPRPITGRMRGHGAPPAFAPFPASPQAWSPCAGTNPLHQMCVWIQKMH